MRISAEMDWDRKSLVTLRVMSLAECTCNDYVYPCTERSTLFRSGSHKVLLAIYPWPTFALPPCFSFFLAVYCYTAVFGQ
jgi:hypothetical protein